MLQRTGPHIDSKKPHPAAPNGPHEELGYHHSFANRYAADASPAAHRSDQLITAGDRSLGDDPTAPPLRTTTRETTMERSRRNVQSRTAKLAGVLDSLKAAREGGGPKRASTYEVKQEDAVFDVVDEAQYEQLVAKRRLETGAIDRGVGEGGEREYGVALRRRRGSNATPPLHPLPTPHPPCRQPSSSRTTTASS